MCGSSEVDSVAVMEVPLAMGTCWKPHGRDVLGCWGTSPMQGPDSELAAESQLVGLDAIAGKVARTSVVNVRQRCLRVVFLFSPRGC